MSQQLYQAISLVKEYSCITPKTPDSEDEKKELQSAIKLIVSLADAENLGICASNSQEALDTLKSYLKAFGYDFDSSSDMNQNHNPVYLKFSTERMSYNISGYDGQYRGVLITIFSQNQDEIMGTYGHLPLTLFD